MGTFVSIQLPARVECNQQGFEWLAQTADDLSRARVKLIQFDTSHLTYFEGNLCAPFGALIHRARQAGKEVRCNRSGRGKVLGVWMKNDFWAKVFDGPGMTDTFDTTPGYEHFALGYDKKHFADYFQREMMSKELPDDLTSSARTRFAQGTQEIFDNAMSHSRSDGGVFSCGQFFPHRYRLTFAFADLGCGFARTVEKVSTARLSDEAAIHWCVQRGHTSRAGGKGGLGLAHLRDFMMRNAGRLQIVSGRGFWQLNSQRQVARSTLRYPFPGSFVNIELNTLDKKPAEEIADDEVL